MRRYASRKFWLAAFSLLAVITGLFLHFIDGTTFVAALGVVLGSYKLADIVDKKVNGGCQ